jgi:hypothetical protein
MGDIKASVEQRKQKLREEFEKLALKEDAIEDEHDRLEKMRKEASSVLMLEYGNMSKQTEDCL